MPSDFLLAGEHVEGELRDRNLALMLAYTVFKQGLCPHCGYPSEICRNQERFKAQKLFCHAKAAVDQAQADEKDPEHGQFWVPEYQKPVEI